MFENSFRTKKNCIRTSTRVTDAVKRNEEKKEAATQLRAERGRK